MSHSRNKTSVGFFKPRQSTHDTQEQEEIQVNKKPEYELVSSTDMFEMLYIDGKSPPITITDTLLFESCILCLKSLKPSALLALQSPEETKKEIHDDTKEKQRTYYNWRHPHERVRQGLC